ncbi:MAG: virulence factor, partial [Rhodospirillales bacterium]
MAQLTIIYWRDIPAQVIVKAGHASAKRQLDERFQEAIDLAAMRARRNETDDSLAEWRRGESEPCGDDCEAEAAKAGNRLARVAMIEAAWLWVRHQPDSALTQWFHHRTQGQKGRIRRVM